MCPILRNAATRLSRVSLLAVVAGLTVLASTSIACADEIVYQDPETCEEITVNAPEIVSETWTEVRYRERSRGPEESIPTAAILEIKRDSPKGKELLSAISELRRGKISDARRQLQTQSGGGYKMNLESGVKEYYPFTANDPGGRRRPPWPSEYAHFFYAKALYLDGIARKDEELHQEAYLALVDQKVPGGNVALRDKDGNVLKDATTGGFLKRFAGGNSRWLPEAMLLKAKVLVALGRFDEASAAYSALADQAIAVDIGLRWAYEAKLGPGVIAEAQGNALDARKAYIDAANFMKLLLEKETKPCLRRDLGRYFSRARMRAAAVRLKQAEKAQSEPEFRRLRGFIEEGMPDALRKTFRTLPKPQLEALVQGALDPEVQAVAQIGLGLAFLNEKQYEKAILAFRTVEVKYFAVPEEHARALHYLARAAEAAAKEAQGGAKDLYSRYRDDALQRLREEHPGSPWTK